MNAAAAKNIGALVVCLSFWGCGSGAKSPTAASTLPPSPDVSSLPGTVIAGQGKIQPPGVTIPQDAIGSESAGELFPDRWLSYANFAAATQTRLQTNDELLVVFTNFTPVGTKFRIKLTLFGDRASSNLNMHPGSFQVPPDRLFRINIGDALAFDLNAATIREAGQFVVISGRSPDIGLDQDRSQHAGMYELRLLR